VQVGRSYDGLNWETLHPLLLSIDCQESPCVLDIPAYTGSSNVQYIIREYAPPAPTDDQKHAKLLLQGTYGPTQESLQEARNLGSPEAWVRDQIDKPASLHRVHYRKRANGYVKNALRHHGVRDACERGSRWNRHAFNRWRDIGKTIEEIPTSSGSIYLNVDGIVRTEVPNRPSAEYNIPTTSYVICRKDPNQDSMRMSDFHYAASAGQYGTLLVASDSASCAMPISIEMPSVQFTDATDAFGSALPQVTLMDISGDPNVIEAKLLDQLGSSSCDDFKKTWPNFVQEQGTGLYYVEDRRLELYDNTNSSSTTKSGMLGNRCPRVPRTFLNEDTCIPRADCGPPVFSGEFTLTAENLRKFYEIDNKYVYRLSNLPLVGTNNPCRTNTNRFVRKDFDNDSSGCASDSGPEFPSIVTAIETYLGGLSDPSSAIVIDIEDTSMGCTDNNDDSLGGSFSVTIPGGSQACFTHSYQYEYSVFVMNDWAANHPGNPSAFRESNPNPIAKVAEHENLSGNVEESVVLNFPTWGFHQWNFHNNRWRFDEDLIGNYGDTISFDDLPASAKSPNVVTSLGGTVVSESGEVVEVCSSPGEVANAPELGHQYLLQKYGDAEEEYSDTLDQDHDRWYSNHLVWNTVSLNAADQLRQRVAWALSSIFVVTENDIAREHEVESWAVLYDIFVKNAFADFKSILKGIAFSPLMAEMLTFEGSKSLAYQVERNEVMLYPDENFAREIMQLFSIGLYVLNQDGTKVIDETTGQYVPTYTNSDIVNFSRGWTNFVHQQDERDNVEASWDLGWIPNPFDPMEFPTSEGRDVFPKLQLKINGERSYIGDKVVRCDSLPAKAWLKKGATYHFRENSQSLMGKKDPDWWAEPDDWTPRMVLDPTTSTLYSKLCNFNEETNQCDFKSTVVLDEDIPCDGTCDARRALWDGITFPCECSIDEPRTVRVDHSPTMAPVWYEYVRQPCVQLAFPEPGFMNSVREIGASGYGNKAMCADSRLPVAGTACCDANMRNPKHICVFKGDRTTYSLTEERCAAFGGSTCPWSRVPINWACGSDTSYGQGSYSEDSSPGLRFLWSSEECSMSVQVGPDGNVAMIHSVGSVDVKERVGIDTGTYFGVFWAGDGSFPTASSGCGPCVVHGSTCICPATAVTSIVFDGSLGLPTIDEVITRLHIGAPDPNSFDSLYNLCTAPLCQNADFDIYFSVAVTDDASITNAFDEQTVFEINGSYLINSGSSVDVGGGFSFRNPPMYNSPIDPTQRDALYETDAIIQHFVDHPNTAPFISTKLIQHLVTSNPSPRYVKVVADAFSSGSYTSGGQTFGKGNYGDMEACIAAILLDSEARSSTLDDDAIHGRAREPLLKIMHMFRSMNLSTESDTKREIDMIFLTSRGIGQESFNAPSVFSFFLSEYQPVGPALNKGVVAPETQLFDAPKLISFMNGIFSLPEFGLNDCQWWQGFGHDRARYWIPDYPDGGSFDCNAAENEQPGVPLRLRWKPPSWGGDTNINGAPTSQIIDEMDLLLTGGRLHTSNKAILETVYNDALSGTNPDYSALKAVIPHFAATPEFHITNNLVDSNSVTTTREIPNISIPPNPPPVTGYKAVVYMFLAGAMDSYNALVPGSSCYLNQQYASVRGDVAITNGLLSIDATSSGQPCDSFRLHPSFSNIRDLYNDGDASFIANIGPLIVPMDKYEFEAESKPQPQSLFAHNTQTQITQTVLAQDSSAGGVLGRIGDAINAQEGSDVFDAYSISGTPKILEGAPSISKPADVLSGSGVADFNQKAGRFEDNIESLSQNVVTSIYGETFSASMTNALYRTRLLEGVVGGVTLDQDGCFNNVDSSLADQFQQVAKIIKSRDGLESKRDVFYVSLGGFDTHSDNGPKLTDLLAQVDQSIGCFATEMKGQGVWSNVTVVSASEFGRTLTSNGLGTDHAWGGNHFILGGSVRGGRIHGRYPDDITDEGILSIGRGRLIPTTPWEGLWKGVAQWFGVNTENIESVLPNLPNFATNIFDATELYE